MKTSVRDAVVDLAQACARISDISATPPSLTFAEAQKLTGDGHQPLQHEVAQYADSSSSSGEEYGAIGPGQREASAFGDPASASGEPTEPKNQAPREDSINSPKNQVRLLPRNHWAIYSRACEKHWAIELRSSCQNKDREQCMKKTHPSIIFL